MIRSVFPLLAASLLGAPGLAQDARFETSGLAGRTSSDWGCYVLSEARYANQFELAAGVVLRF